MGVMKEVCMECEREGGGEKRKKNEKTDDRMNEGNEGRDE
jgi:hypothetical protein